MKALMLWTGLVSPDLNPVEHIWNIMSHFIHHRCHVAPQTVHGLTNVPVQVLEEISQEHDQALSGGDPGVRRPHTLPTLILTCPEEVSLKPDLPAL